MNQTVELLVVSLVLPIVVIFLVTWVVITAVRRSPSTKMWQATRAGVLFVVALRRWQSILIRVVAVVAIVVGCLLFLVALTATGEGSTLGMGIAGVAMVVAGILLVWLAHGMRRMRLEVAPDTLWVFRMAGAPRSASVLELTELAPLLSNNYGGIVLRAGGRSVFHATRIMLGYPQLVEFLHSRRPDLELPVGSEPL